MDEAVAAACNDALPDTAVAVVGVTVVTVLEARVNDEIPALGQGAVGEAIIGVLEVAVVTLFAQIRIGDGVSTEDVRAPGTPSASGSGSSCARVTASEAQPKGQ